MSELHRRTHDIDVLASAQDSDGMNGLIMSNFSCSSVVHCSILARHWVCKAKQSRLQKHMDRL